MDEPNFKIYRSEHFAWNENPLNDLPGLREKARAKFEELVPKGVRMLTLNLPSHALEAGYL